MPSEDQYLLKHDFILESPIGFIGIRAHGVQLDVKLLTSLAPTKETPSALAEKAASQIKAYMQNPRQDFNLPIVARGTLFQRKVWEVIRSIPSGQTRSYADIANQLGSGPRAVANACGANRIPLIIPCHRVVSANGLGGFMKSAAGGLEIKKWLLRHEGVVIDEGVV